MHLTTFDFQLPLKHTFTISRESTDVQPTLIVRLSDGTHHGYGEATTNKYYGATLETMRNALEKVRPLVESFPLEDPAADGSNGDPSSWPEKLWHAVQPLIPDDSFAQCALDQAAYDLWGKQRGAPVYALWGLDISRVPQSNFTIGIDRVDVMVQKLREMPGWPIYKIKLGTSEDLQIVRALRDVTDAVFRVDANCGWTAQETIDNSQELARLGVEFIEQPLPADQWEAMREVYRHSALPVVADESCITPDDVARCQGHFHGVNVKLVKCGGLTPARRMIHEARELGMKTMVGCMTESTVGISAIAQLLPLLDYVDMDGAALLASDIATGVEVRQGTCVYPQKNGSGVELIGEVG
jgi:L-alanine-DL-glutamate epimerase-like enolase superfamily enzyme